MIILHANIIYSLIIQGQYCEQALYDLHCCSIKGAACGLINTDACNDTVPSCSMEMGHDTLLHYCHMTLVFAYPETHTEECMSSC